MGPMTPGPVRMVAGQSRHCGGALTNPTETQRFLGRPKNGSSNYVEESTTFLRVEALLPGNSSGTGRP
jgi:hypothetical protein